MMKSLAILAGALVAFGTLASAQEVSTPVAEVGLSYSYTRVNPGGTLSSYNANGGYGYAEYNFNKVFGLVGELGANRVGTVNTVPLSNTSFEYLFGPRFNWRHSRFTPYVQALVGGERYSNGLNPATGAPLLTSQNNFAAALGGGLDVAVTNHIAIKPVQVEWLTTQLSANKLNYVQNDVRYSAGVVFRFGAK
jgi:opacity protein-like surface antigen